MQMRLGFALFMISCDLEPWLSRMEHEGYTGGYQEGTWRNIGTQPRLNGNSTHFTSVDLLRAIQRVNFKRISQIYEGETN